jgi:hypothetical protein
VFISQHLLENYRGADYESVDHGERRLPTAYRGLQCLTSTTDRANKLDNRPVDTGATIRPIDWDGVPTKKEESRNTIYSRGTRH